MRKIFTQAQPLVDFLARLERKVPEVDLFVSGMVDRASAKGSSESITFMWFGHIEHMY